MWRRKALIPLSRMLHHVALVWLEMGAAVKSTLFNIVFNNDLRSTLKTRNKTKCYLVF